jgi:N-acetylmuramoyl-L-alanine amidase
MKIENHRLVGEGIAQRESPNRGGIYKPRYLVMHYTASQSPAGAISWLCDPKSKASAHIVLGRDGSITQLVPFNVVAWHAGESQWNGIVGMNKHSIGIEIDNAGKLSKVGDRFTDAFGKPVAAADVKMAEHKHGGGVQPWHAYSPVQIERAMELAELLCSDYGLEDIIGHEDIARGRKSDPGPAFPLATLQARQAGRKDDAPPRYVVNAPVLNIRKGPGAEFDTVAPALKSGTVVTLLEPSDRWSRVEVVGPTDIEGWVNNQFIAPQATIARGIAPRGTIARGAGGASAKAGKRAARKSPTVAARAPAKKAAASRKRSATPSTPKKREQAAKAIRKQR